MQKILSFHIGNAGIQIGNSYWEQLALEHHISPEGLQTVSTPNEHLGVSFSEDSYGHFVSNSIFLDLDTDSIASLRKGPLAKIYKQSNFLSANEGTGGIYSEGLYGVGKTIAEKFIEQIRRQAEKTGSIQGLQVTSSICGGTGSGFTSKILELLTQDFPKKSRVWHAVGPSNNSGPLEVYNAVLSTHALMEYCDIATIVNNEAMYEVWKRNCGIHYPSFCHINKLLTSGISGQTVSMRFKGDMNATISEFISNMIPYPRVHFIIPSYAPLSLQSLYTNPSVMDLTQTVLSPNSIMTSGKPLGDERSVALSLMYRGDVEKDQVKIALTKMKEDKVFELMDFSPTGVRAGINPNAGEVARSVCAFNNSAMIARYFETYVDKFDKLHSKRAFIYSYVMCGQEEGEFSESREDIAAAIKDFEEVC